MVRYCCTVAYRSQWCFFLCTQAGICEHGCQGLSTCTSAPHWGPATTFSGGQCSMADHRRVATACTYSIPAQRPIRCCTRACSGTRWLVHTSSSSLGSCSGPGKNTSSRLRIKVLCTCTEPAERASSCLVHALQPVLKKDLAQAVCAGRLCQVKVHKPSWCRCSSPWQRGMGKGCALQ